VLLIGLFISTKTHPAEKPHLFWFYIYGFNITILARLLSTFFGRVLGRKRRGLAAALSGVRIALDTLVVGAQTPVADPVDEHLDFG
jgi:hypothetical protein